MSTTHAILSPSGASRWLNCTPSARLEQQFPDRAGEAAREGTLAHELAEIELSERTGKINKFQAKDRRDKVTLDPLYNKEMKGHVDDYVVFIMEEYNSALARTSGADIYLEMRLDLTDYIPDGFGTGDVGIVENATLHIVDLKYGKGVPVSAEDNKQLKIYALGALKEFNFIYDIELVRMTIYQPRLNNISTWEITVADLLAWAVEILKPKADLAFKGLGDFAPGEHCRFCKAAGICKANADMNLELAKYDFAEAMLMADEEVSDVLRRADNFIRWITAVEEYAMTEALRNGKKWPGYKLVEGRSNRQYIDRDEVAKHLEKITAGSTDAYFKPRELIGIGEMEKLMGKPFFAQNMADHVVKPAGKPTLVPVSDKRPELNTAEAAAADFADITIDS